jgi:hypothetical protein
MRDQQSLQIGDMVKFTKAGKHFHPECDIGVIVAHFTHPSDRPWLVRWDHGVESRPVAAYLAPVQEGP